MHLETYKNEVEIGMRNKLLHPQKKHLIEHISDDARTLRKSDVALQKVLLTGRAVKDILSGDTIRTTNDSDTSYFNEQGVLDLDSIVDASIRYIDVENGTGSYLHGPLAGTVNEKTGNALIHTLAVLPSGALSYDDTLDGEYAEAYLLVDKNEVQSPVSGTTYYQNVNGQFVVVDVGSSWPDGDFYTVNANPHRSYPKHIRQIYYPDNPRDMDAYTRIGTLSYDVDNNPVYTWENWISLSGRLLRILVKVTDEISITDINSGILDKTHLIPYTIYELHCGAVIELPNADDMIPATSIAFEQYANTNYSYRKVTSAEIASGPDINTPYFKIVNGVYTIQQREDANGNYHQVSALTSDMYVREPLEQWASTVTYTEMVPSENGTTALVERTYTTTLVPGLDTSRITYNASGSGFNMATDTGKWYEASNQAILYRFEAVHRETPIAAGTYTKYYDNQPQENNSYYEGSELTWLLDADADTLDAINGFAEILDSHTDQSLRDFLMYDKRHFSFKDMDAAFSGANAWVGAMAHAANTGVSADLCKTEYNETLVLSQPATARGVAKLTLSLSDKPYVYNGTSHTLSLTDNFKLKLYKVNESDEQFDPTALSLTWVEVTPDEISAGPSPYKKYYVYDELIKFSLAAGTGHPEQFEANKKYYTRQLSVSGNLPVTTCLINGSEYACEFGGSANGTVTITKNGASTSYSTVSRLSTLWKSMSDAYIKTSDVAPDPNKTYYFVSVANGAASVASATIADTTGHITAFESGKTYYEKSDDVIHDGVLTAFINVARNDTIIAVIQSGNHFIDQRIVVPEIVFLPDPHDSYVREADKNNNAFTRSFLNKESLPCSPEESVPTSDALAKAYETIASAMQSKGLAFGHLPSSGSIDDITAPGIYTIKSGTTITDTAHHTTSNNPVFLGGTLIVFSDEAIASSNRLLPLRNKFSASNIVQLIFGYRTSGTLGEFWWRISHNGSFNGVKWMRLTQTPVIWDVSTDSSQSNKNVVTAEQIESHLGQGPLIVVFSGNPGVDATVTLPDPKYHKNDKMQIETVKRKITIQYTVGSTTYKYENTPSDNFGSGNHMLYPLECDGTNWYVITVS